MTYTLYSVLSDGTERSLWTHDYWTCPDQSDVDQMAEHIISGMDDHADSVSSVEWTQDGVRYLIRRTL